MSKVLLGYAVCGIGHLYASFFLTYSLASQELNKSWCIDVRSFYSLPMHATQQVRHSNSRHAHMTFTLDLICRFASIFCLRASAFSRAAGVNFFSFS